MILSITLADDDPGRFPERRMRILLEVENRRSMILKILTPVLGDSSLYFDTVHRAVCNGKF